MQMVSVISRIFYFHPCKFFCETTPIFLVVPQQKKLIETKIKKCAKLHDHLYI